MKKTNFDRYLEEQRQDPAFAARLESASKAWDDAAALSDTYADLRHLPAVKRFKGGERSCRAENRQN